MQCAIRIITPSHSHLLHPHPSTQIAVIRVAKEKGVALTCEVCPHHLFLCEEDMERIGQGRAQVRPCLVSRDDQQALWDNMDIIDCFSTDHGQFVAGTSTLSHWPQATRQFVAGTPLLSTFYIALR